MKLFIIVISNYKPEENMIIDTKELHEFENIINYRFNNIEILEKSLTHSSYSNEDKAYCKVNNERLEFLGDAVLSISVSRFIFDKFKFREIPSFRKGRRSIRRQRKKIHIGRCGGSSYCSRIFGRRV